MVRYQKTIAIFRDLVQKKFPGAIVKEADLTSSFNEAVLAGDPDSMCLMAGHLLWMLEKIESMEPEQMSKAGRWIGWVIAYAEVMGFITNAQSREVVRTDVQNGDE